MATSQKSSTLIRLVMVYPCRNLMGIYFLLSLSAVQTLRKSASDRSWTCRSGVMGLAWKKNVWLRMQASDVFSSCISFIQILISCRFAVSEVRSNWHVNNKDKQQSLFTLAFLALPVNWSIHCNILSVCHRIFFML